MRRIPWRRWLASFGELYDRFASAKPPSSCCITGVALQMEAKAEAARRAEAAAPQPLRT